MGNRYKLAVSANRQKLVRKIQQSAMKSTHRHNAQKFILRQEPDLYSKVNEVERCNQNIFEVIFNKIFGIKTRSSAKAHNRKVK